MEMTRDIPSQKDYFSSTREFNDGCYIKDNKIYYKDELIISTEELKVKGKHSHENIMAAILVCKRVGVDTKFILEVLKEFKGVEHRVEFVREFKGRTFYNDSKATNVTATQTALQAFDNPTILILGGLDRGHSFEPLIPYMKNVKLVVCYGETKNRIKEFCDKINIECIVLDNLTDATNEAYDRSREGDVILLSPACASWDQFTDFEVRGRLFKELVNKL
jgi:UDP-N-acetylmuramoylalanine--D-glutamate ligase